MSNSKEEEISCCGKVIREVRKRIWSWLAEDIKEEWLKEMRGMLSLVATVIATMTYQGAVNPPGGVRPVKESGTVIECSSANQNETNPCPGEAVLSIVKKDTYERFLYCNTVCFVASLAVCLLLVSGLPLEDAYIIRLFSIGMCIAISSLTLTYFFGVQMVTPNSVWNSSIFTMFGLVLFIWILLLGIVVFFLSLRLIRSVSKWRVGKSSKTKSADQKPSKEEDET